jgi:DDB1- and CUL4-associated factor 13
MEAFNFAAASEDGNIYVYDMRKLTRALNVLKDHVSAVMDVEFSPTGEELVSGSYDKSIRIFKTREGHSRDVYHTKRMQRSFKLFPVVLTGRVFAVKFSMDAKYIVSGSDDGNVRLWRANASDRSVIRTTRERQQLQYSEHLKEQFKHMPEIRRIARRRHVPKAINKEGEKVRTEVAAIKRKDENRRKHSKPGKVLYTVERTKHIVAQKE